jgi:polysaccharide deacetylase 2 family uncharacterized protein YibQ
MTARRRRRAKALWPDLLRTYQRHAARHRGIVVTGLLVLCALALLFATLSSRRGDNIPRPSAARPETGPLAPARPFAPLEKPEKPAKPAEEAAVRQPPLLAAPVSAKPTWLRNAMPAPPTGNRPLVAIVLDDLGLDRLRTADAIRLRGPLTLSFMTYASDLAGQTQSARRAGHELLLHVPMEAVDQHADPGPHGLFTVLSRDEILERLRWGLDRVDGFVGINNHMGSKFTSDERGMAPVMEELHVRGLVFLDSRTSPSSVGIRMAAAYGVPHAARDVFLDDDQTPAAITKELERLEQLARRRGSAIAIGHPHDATIAALKAWLPLLGEKGLALVPVSTVVQRRMAEEGELRH